MFYYFSTFLKFVGLVSILGYLFHTFKSLFALIKGSLFSSVGPKLADRYGNWAVITGCTDGVGKEYSYELAKQNINLVLISRTESKLVALSKEIEAKYSVKTKWIAADFSKSEGIYDHIKQELSGIEVGILVNNVGLMYDHPDDIDELPEQKIWDLINVNIAAVTFLTHMIIPDMKKRRRGIITNISSASDLQPVPYQTIYAATKSYVKSFTLGLRFELEPYNISVQLVSPMYIATKMVAYSSTLSRANIFIPDAKQFSRFAAFTLGKTDDTTGYWSHGIQIAVLNLLPLWLKIKAAGDDNKRWRTDTKNKKKLVKKS